MNEPQTTEEVLAWSHEVLASKARTFSLAGRFLPAQAHDDAAIVYAMCRVIDDAADLATDAASARVALASIEAELRGEAPARPLIREFLRTAARIELELGWTFELIEGVRADLEPVMFASDAELIRYGYRVAGTVGLMMCAVIGVRDPKAWAYALDLGVAMQLTNICRDVAEDAQMGRVYLPAERLRAQGTSPEALLDGTADPRVVARVVRHLLAIAERYYASADQGMRFIPARSRTAILVASRVYRAIGLLLRQRGGDALAGRTIVPPSGKAMWVAAALRDSARPHIQGRAPLIPHDPALHVALIGLPGADPDAESLPPFRAAAE